jgi:hypothetical protein
LRRFASHRPRNAFSARLFSDLAFSARADTIKAY